MTVLAIVALVLVALWWFFRESNRTGKDDDTQSSSDAEEKLFKSDIKPHTIEDRTLDIKKTSKQLRKEWEILEGKSIDWTGFVRDVIGNTITCRVPYEGDTSIGTCKVRMNFEKSKGSEFEELSRYQIIRFSGKVGSGEISSTSNVFKIELKDPKVENIYDTIIECTIAPSAGEALRALYRLHEVDD